MKKKEIYFLIFILTALLAAGLIIYSSKKIEILPITETEIPFPGYSYKNVIYNFWGFVVTKEGGSVSVEGIIPEPGKTEIDQPLQTIKFKITPKTRILKLETVKLKEPKEETKQIFVELEAIQLNDHLALKSEKINAEKKEAIATDILILESLPPVPPRPGTTTSPDAVQ